MGRACYIEIGDLLKMCCWHTLEFASITRSSRCLSCCVLTGKRLLVDGIDKVQEDLSERVKMAWVGKGRLHSSASYVSGSSYHKLLSLQSSLQEDPKSLVVFAASHLNFLNRSYHQY